MTKSKFFLCLIITKSKTASAFVETVLRYSPKGVAFDRKMLRTQYFY